MAKALILKDGRIRQLAAPDYLESDQMFDIRDGGAAVNGTTDDGAAIQSALDEAYTAGGGIIFFPRGTTRISSQVYRNFLSPTDRTPLIVFQGEGSGSRIMFSGLGGNVGLGTGNTHITKFRGLTFVGSTDMGAADSNYNFIEVGYATRAVFEGCLFVGLAHSGSGANDGVIRLNSTFAAFRDCKFGDCTSVNEAVIKAFDMHGLVIENTMFIDHSIIDGTTYGKIPNYGAPKHWIKMSQPIALDNAQQNPTLLVMKNCQLDEAPTDSQVLVTTSGDAVGKYSVSLENVSVNSGQYSTTTNPAYKFSGLRHVRGINCWAGYQSRAGHNVMDVTDTAIVDLDNFQTNDNSHSIRLLGTTAKLKMRNCSGFSVTNTAGAAVKYDDAPAVRSIASSAAPTINADIDEQLNVTALAEAATMAAPAGTPRDGQEFKFRIKDNGTARALSYNAAFRAVGVTLPTTTVIGKTIYLGGKYNAADSKLDVVAVAIEA